MFLVTKASQWIFMCGTPTCGTNGSCDVSVWVFLHLTPQLSSVVQSHILTSNMFGSAALLRYATIASCPLSAALSRGVYWWKQNNKYNATTRKWLTSGQGGIQLILTRLRCTLTHFITTRHVRAWVLVNEAMWIVWWQETNWTNVQDVCAISLIRISCL